MILISSTISAVERRLIAVINKNKSLINKFDRNWIHPLNRKFENWRVLYILMELMEDVLSFSNEFGFTDDVSNDDLEKERFVKQKLIEEFEDCSLPNLIQVSNIIDEIFFIQYD